MQSTRNVVRAPLRVVLFWMFAAGICLALLMCPSACPAVALADDGGDSVTADTAVAWPGASSDEGAVSLSSRASTSDDFSGTAPGDALSVAEIASSELADGDDLVSLPGTSDRARNAGALIFISAILGCLVIAGAWVLFLGKRFNGRGPMGRRED